MAATLPLALGLAADVFVVIAKIARSALAGAIVAALVFGGFVALWYVYPLRRRRLVARRAASAARGPSAAP